MKHLKHLLYLHLDHGVVLEVAIYNIEIIITIWLRKLKITLQLTTYITSLEWHLFLLNTFANLTYFILTLKH